MHTGLSLIFQNLDGKHSDAEVYRHELALAARAEAAGFDSVWTPEHHFSDYQLTPNVPQFLSWVAGRTERVKLGTMVSVLPWHDPVRVAESFCLLDHLSQGRAILGVGRGLGRIEFDGFRVKMNESRTRFVEYTDAILRGLESGVMQYDGELYRQPPVKLRPAPFASFKGRSFASAISPQSMDIMARLGVGLMVIAQKPWETVEQELAAYRVRYRELNRERAAEADPVRVRRRQATTPSEARRMREIYLQRYAALRRALPVRERRVRAHRRLRDDGALSRNIAKHGRQVQRLPRRPPGVGQPARGDPEAARLRASRRRRSAARHAAFGGRPWGRERELRAVRARSDAGVAGARRRRGRRRHSRGA